MINKDFFRLIIKLFALYSIITTIFYSIPSSLSFALMDFDFYSILFIVGFTLLTLFLITLLLFKADWIIKILKLDKGFDSNEVSFQNFNLENIVKISIIITGGLLVIENFPKFLTYLIYIFKTSLSVNEFSPYNTNSQNFKDYIELGTRFINIIVGYLLLTNFNTLSKFLLKQNRKNDKEETKELN